jgi:hypothetical protein
LTKDVELWIPIENASGDELVEDTDNKRREDGKKDVVQR